MNWKVLKVLFKMLLYGRGMIFTEQLGLNDANVFLEEKVWW